MKKIIIILLLILFSFFSILAQNFWQQSEFPSLYSGDIYCLDAMDNMVIASSYQDGLAISTNFGENWFVTRPTGNFQPYYSVDIINSGYLFALGFNGVLYRSTDTGANWLQCSNTIFGNSPKITSGNNGILYVGSWQGVYRSTDSGETWTLQNAGLEIGGSSPFVKVNISSNGILAAATPSGVFKSTDNANSWFRVSPIGASNIAVNSSGYVYADKYREDPYLYIDTLYRTTDNGISWEPLKHWRGLFIFINPTDDAIALADYDYYSDYFLSTNYGMTWSTVITEKSPVCMSYNGNGGYFMGTNGVGMFKSNSLSASWQPCNIGFPGTITKVTSILSNGDILFAATNSFGLFSSTNDGISFSKISSELNNLNVGKLAATSNGNMFAMAIQGTILRSTDLGISWHYYPPPGVLYDLVTFCLCTNGNIVLTGGCRASGGDAELDRSTDNGTTWDEVFFIPGSYNYTEYKIIALAINNDGIALGCVEKRHNVNPPMPTWIYSYAIIRSTDHGLTWNTTNYTYDKIKNFVWNSSSEIFAITSDGLLKSTDDGLTWNYTSGILPTTDLKSIVIDYYDDIYIGTGNMGVIYSTDDGNNWMTLNEGMTDSVINSIYISSSGYLFAGAEYGGVYRSIDTVNPVLVIPDIFPKAYVLHQNYPNPFNPSTTIRFEIPERIFVTIKVYDVLGNEVATLENEEKLEGEYEVEFSGNVLTSGIYFYQIKAGSFIQTKKMVIMK